MNEPVKITPASMAMLGVGWFGMQFFWGFHTATIPLFLNDFTDSKFMISVVLSLPGVAGCIVPPIVGYLSDRNYGRLGRRRPYIIIGILGVFLCILGLPHMTVFWLVALISGLMYFSLRIAETPYLSLLPDITPPKQRATTSGAMNFCGSIGLITYFVIGSRIWDANPKAVFYVVAAVCFGAVLTAILLIREPEAPQQRTPETTDLSGGGPFSYLKGIAEETNAMRFFIAQFFWWFGFWMISAFITLFVVEELNVAEGKSFLVLMAFSIAATVFMLPMGMLGDRLGRKGILSCMLGFWAVAGVCMGLSQNFVHALITVGITGIPFAAMMGVGYAYLLDLIPRERTAEFVGFSIISVAAAQFFGPLLGGKLIDMLGYRLIFPVGAAFMIVGLIILQFVQPRQAKETTG